MRIVTLIILFASFNLYSQEIEYQLYLKNSCNDSIEKAVFYFLKKGEQTYETLNLDNPIIRIPASGNYQLISEETNEKLTIEISRNNSKDTLLLPSIYKLEGVLPASYKKDISESELKKLRKKSRSVFRKCESNLNGEQKEYFTNGIMRFYGNFKNGFAVGEIKEYYQNGNIKKLLIYDNDGYFKKKVDYDRSGIEIKK
ncbi:hypothetical protein [Confluentibacter citreus]|uniref:hypothetical protein n=1 Tax=Confluentibacter citreus TaxID=2007307 RepID=UPI0012FDB47B|nr:hypothetical protein [Confluentibacter citreus]